MKTILIIGDDTRSFLACIRSFGRAGFEVHVAGFGDKSEALGSRYIVAKHALPLYKNDGTDWKTAIIALVLKEKIQAILPCDERALLPLAKHREELPKGIWLGIPNQQAIDAFFSKLNTRNLAIELEVPVANGKLVDVMNASIGSLNLEAPVAIKPINSFTLEATHARQEVTLLRTKEELAQASSKLLSGKYLLEELFEGDGKGISVLAKNGKLLASFQHKRSHPELNGSSGYRVSEPLSPSMHAAVVKICLAVNFSGIAMFEFKFDSEHRWILLEVNARPWGSLPLAMAAGIDFPIQWYQSKENDATVAVLKYSYGFYGRNIRQDSYYIKAKVRGQSGFGNKIKTAFLWLRTLRHIFVGKESWDELTIDDPTPGIMTIKSLLFDKVIKPRIPDYEALRTQIRKAIQTEYINSTGLRPLKVEFVCYGNICRSPFAELISKKIVTDIHLIDEQILISSSGLMPIEGRQSPKMAIESASQRKVDLSHHFSSFLSPLRCDQASLIVFFDDKNRNLIEARDSKNMSKFINLAHLAGHRELADPYGGNMETFDNSYRKIEAACLLLFKTIKDELEAAKKTRVIYLH